MDDFVTKSMETVLNNINNKIVTQKEILEKTKLSPRTLRFAISRLKKLELVGEINEFKDARKKKYFKRGRSQ